jgi:hypothetical protein
MPRLERRLIGGHKKQWPRKTQNAQKKDQSLSGILLLVAYVFFVAFPWFQFDGRLTHAILIPCLLSCGDNRRDSLGG